MPVVRGAGVGLTDEAASVAAHENALQVAVVLPSAVQGIGVHELEVVGLHVAHVPQVAAHLHGHLDAVAGVVQCVAEGLPSVVAVEALKHLVVGFVAAAGEDHTVLGAHVHRAVVDSHFDSVDDASDRILDEVLAGGFVPYVDVVCPRCYGFAEQLVGSAVAAPLVHCQHAERLRAGHLGVLDLPFHERRAFSAEILDPLFVLHHLAAIGLDDGIAGGFVVAAHSLHVGDGVVEALRPAEQLHAGDGVAARFRLRCLLQQEDAGSLVRGRDGAVGAGASEADDDHVVFGVPGNGALEGVAVFSRSGRGCLRGASGKGGAAEKAAGCEGRPGQEVAAGKNVIHG